jgi:hypothetical protein
MRGVALAAMFAVNTAVSGSSSASSVMPSPSSSLDRWRRYSLRLMPAAAVCFMVGIGKYRTVDLGIAKPSLVIAGVIWLGATLHRRRLERDGPGETRGFGYRPEPCARCNRKMHAHGTRTRAVVADPQIRPSDPLYVDFFATRRPAVL